MTNENDKTGPADDADATSTAAASKVSGPALPVRDEARREALATAGKLALTGVAVTLLLDPSKAHAFGSDIDPPP